jgi:hypothetical protein
MQIFEHTFTIGARTTNFDHFTATAPPIINGTADKLFEISLTRPHVEPKYIKREFMILNLLGFFNMQQVFAN